MSWWEALLLIIGGLFAGGINTVAGGGSSLTVPLLVLAGVPGVAANGSNRVGVLTSNIAAAASFRRLGIAGLEHAAAVIVPIIAGSLVGSLAISRLADETFETVFGLLMVPIIILALRKPKIDVTRPTWSRLTTIVVFFAIGIYGGAIQAGVGLVLVVALVRAGFDIVDHRFHSGADSELWLVARARRRGIPAEHPVVEEDLGTVQRELARVVWRAPLGTPARVATHVRTLLGDPLDFARRGTRWCGRRIERLKRTAGR